MEVTSVRISLRNDPKLKAFVSITLSECFVVRGLKVINGNNGYFIAMPTRERPDGSHQDLAHPINKEARDMIESAVLTSYEAELARHGGPPPAAGK